VLQSSILWNQPPADLALSSDDVHVWRASLDESPSKVQQLAQILSPDEQARAARFYFEQHRKRFIVARGLLRTILSYYLKIQPIAIDFTYSKYGKPELATASNIGKLEFNVSHSQDLALYAVTRDRQIGIDLEQIRPVADAQQIVERFFSEQEKIAFQSLPAEQKQAAFFNAWTRKEAYLKACGDGLNRPLNQVEVSMTPGESATLIKVEGSLAAANHWCLQALTPAPDYAAAMVVEGHDWQLNCWQYF